MYALMARTILLYLLIVAGLRIMGKRQIGELQPSELVVTILISNIATLPIQDVDVPLSGGIVPILTIVCFEVFISGLTMRSRTARRPRPAPAARALSSTSPSSMSAPTMRPTLVALMPVIWVRSVRESPWQAVSTSKSCRLLRLLIYA